MKVRVDDRSKQFASASDMAIDRTLNNMAVDIIRLSAMQVPHWHGALQASGKITRKGLKKFEVEYNTPYARRWEYTTPPGGFKKGRKSRYLRDPAELITKPENALRLLEAEVARIRV